MLNVFDKVIPVFNASASASDASKIAQVIREKTKHKTIFQFTL